MKYCTKCGAQMEEDARFCPACGNAADANDNVPQMQERPNPVLKQPTNNGYQNFPANNNNNDNNKNIIIIALIAVIVIFAIVMVVMMLVNSKNSKGAAETTTTEVATTQTTTTEETTTEATTTEETTTEAAKKKKKKTSSKEKVPIGKGTCPTNYDTYYALVDTGYLALRSAKNNSNDNIIGKMDTGDPVYVVKSDGLYWYVYSPILGMYGYTNSGYLSTYDSSTSVDSSKYTVNVKSGTYLALRSSAKTSDNNIVGKIYRGDTVEVYEFGGQFWYVYSPTLGMWGYVNSDYLEME